MAERISKRQIGSEFAHGGSDGKQQRGGAQDDEPQAQSNGCEHDGNPPKGTYPQPQYVGYNIRYKQLKRLYPQASLCNRKRPTPGERQAPPEPVGRGGPVANNETGRGWFHVPRDPEGYCVLRADFVEALPTD